MLFLELRREPWEYSRVMAGMILQNRVCLMKSGLLSSYEGHLSNLLEAWQDSTDASCGESVD